MPSISDPLLRLIADMTKHEKRYFKLYSTFYNKEKGNRCLKLFEAVERLKPRTGAALARAVKDEPFARQFAVVKNQLLEQILDCLAAYQSAPRNQAAVQRLLAHADVMIEKGQYTYAARLLDRAQKKAARAENHVWLIEILNRRRALLIRRVTPDFEENIHALYSDVRKALEQLSSTVGYRELMDLLQILVARYASTPTAEDMKKMARLIDHPLLRDPSQALSFDAKVALHYIRGTYAFFTNNVADAIDQFRSGIRVWRDHPVLLKEQPARYGRYLLNYINCLISDGDEQEFAAVTSEAKKLCAPGLEDIVQLKDLWNFEFLFYINRGNLHRCQTTIREMEQYMATYADHIDPPTFVIMCHNCSIYYFLKGNYNRALHYIITIQNESRVELKLDIQLCARLFILVIHYELGNFDILDSMIRSAKRYLKKNEVSDALARIVMKWIGVLLGSADQVKKNAAYHSLRSDLVRLLHEHISRGEIAGLLELLLWTEGKISKQSVEDVFTEKMTMAGRLAPQIMFPSPLHTKV